MEVVFRNIMIAPVSEEIRPHHLKIELRIFVPDFAG
jgi:hypothetical protein